MIEPSTEAIHCKEVSLLQVLHCKVQGLFKICSVLLLYFNNLRTISPKLKMIKAENQIFNLLCLVAIRVPNLLSNLSRRLHIGGIA